LINIIYNGYQLLSIVVQFLILSEINIQNILLDLDSQHSSVFDNKSQNQHFNDISCSIRSILSTITYLDYFLIRKVKSWVRLLLTFIQLILVCLLCSTNIMEFSFGQI